MTELNQEQKFRFRLRLEQERAGEYGREDGYASDTALTQGVYGGVADVMGAPVDLMTAAIEGITGAASKVPNSPFFAPGLQIPDPVGGSQQWRRAFGSVNLPSGNPATYQNLQHVPEELRPVAVGGEAVGGSLPLMFAPYAKGMGAISKAATSAPKAFMGGELAGATGAALGAGWAEEFDPGDVTTRSLMEMGGGFLHPTSVLARHGAASMQNAREQVGAFFTRKGRETAVGSYLRKALEGVGENPEQIARLLREQNLASGLTSGQKTGSPTMLAMEATLVKQNPMLGEEFKGRAQKSLGTMRELIDQMQATGDPALLRSAAQLRQNYFNDLLTGRFRKAQQELSSKLANLGGDAVAESRQASTILEGALTTARNAESQLWDAVPKSVQAKTNNTLSAFETLKQSMLPEERVSPLVTAVMQRLSPKLIKSGLIDAKGNPIQLPAATASIPAGDLYRLRSRMLAGSRDARGKGEFDKARQFNAIAEGAYDDLTAIEAKEGQIARDYSRSLNDAFSRTFAADALAVEGTGARKIHPETLLDQAFRGGGAKADIRFRQLEGAARFAGTSLADQQARFLRAAAEASLNKETGRLNSDRLRKFMDDNSAMLDRFPLVKADLSNAVTAENALRGVETSNAAATKALRQRSAFAHLVNYEDPSHAIANVLQGKNPVKDFGRLTSLAWRTGMGEVNGMKAATIDYAANRAMRSGEFSFEDFTSALNSPITTRGPSLLEMMQRTGVMSPGEVTRLRAITTEAAKINNALKTRAALDMTNTPDGLYDLVVRITGAKIGGMAGRGTGAPIVAAGAGSKFSRKLFEKMPLSKAQDVMIEAAKSPQFAAALLEKNLTRQQALKTEKYINAFLIQAGLTSLQTND